MAAVVKEILWFRSILRELGYPQTEPSIVYCDCQPAISLCKNPISSARSKHIHVKYHFLREHYENGTFTLKYCSTKDMLADGLTKALPKTTCHEHRTKLQVLPVWKGKELENRRSGQGSGNSTDQTSTSLPSTSGSRTGYGNERMSEVVPNSPYSNRA